MQSVGQVAMDLVLNQRQFNKELNNVSKTVTNTFSKLKNIAISAFSVVAIKNFSSACENAYKEQIESERKLFEVMSKRENATKESVKDILNLADAQQKLGVIGDEVQLAGAQELSTYIEKADSIRSLLPIMNNMLAQQYGYNATQEEAVNIATMMGKVLDGQTGALSRYGYYFDENQEKILKFGNEEQRVAVLTKIVQDSIGDVNAALGDTPIGRQIQLANAWGDVKEQIGYVIAQVKQALIPVFSVLVNILGRAVSYVRQFMQALGFTAKASKKTSSAVNYGGTNIDSYAAALDNATSSAKKLRKAMGNIDELHILSKGSSSDSGSGSGTSGLGDSGGVGGVNDIDYNMGIDGDVEVSNKIQTVADKAIKAFEVVKQRISGLFQPFKNAWDTYGSGVFDSFKNRAESSINLVDSIYSAFEKVWTNGSGEKFIGNILKGITNINNIYSNIKNSIADVIQDTGLGESIIQHIFDILNDGIETVNQIGIYFQEITLSESFQNAIKYVGEIINIIADVASKIMKVIKQWVMSEKFQSALNVVMNVVADILKYAKEIISWVSEMYDKYLYPVLTDVFDLISEIIIAIGKVWNALQPVISFLWNAFKTIIEPIFASVMAKIKNLIEAFKNIIKFWGDMWGSIKDTVSSVWNFIKGLFSAGGKIFDGIVGSISNTFKTVVNSITGGINKVISIPFEKVNGLLNKIRSTSILGVEPFKGFWGYNPLPVPKIPMLAQGAYFPRNNPQLAIVGDNTREGEITTPESKIYEQTDKAIKDNQSSGGIMEIHLYHHYEDGRTIIQKINKTQIEAGEVLLYT